MSGYLIYAALGLGTAAVYAALGLGLVVTYRGSGVVHFGYGATGMLGTYVFINLRNSGLLDLPIPGTPTAQISSGPLSFLPSLAIAIIFAAVIGWLTHKLVFYPLRAAPALAKVVASIGLMVAFPGMAVIRYGSDQVTVPVDLPTGSVSIFGQSVPENRFIIAGIVIVIGVVIGVFFTYNRVGVVLRASSENELGVSLLGWSPRRLSALTWVSASVLATIVGILIAPITSVTASNFTLLIVPALAAAVVARFSSFTWCIATGFLIGIVESWLTKLQIDVSWLSNLTGVQDAVPLVVILGALLISGQPLPSRGATETSRLPSSPAPKHIPRTVGLFAVVSVALVVLLHGGGRYAAVTTMVEVVICLSFVVVTGYLGQVSLFQLTISGLAGFFVSILAQNWGLPFPLAAFVATMAGAAVGALLGLPALLVRGVNLAILTLAVAYTANILLFQNQSFDGFTTPRSVPSPRLFGVSFAVTDASGGYRIAFGLAMVVLATAALAAVLNLRRTMSGRQLLAVRSNERAASALGINVISTKISGFAVGSALAALGGVMLAYSQVGGSLSFDGFDATSTIAVLAFVYLGGISRPLGAVVGATLASNSILTYLLDRVWSGFTAYSVLIGGIALILTVIANPEGIAGTKLPFVRRPGRRELPASVPDGPPATAGPGARLSREPSVVAE